MKPIRILSPTLDLQGEIDNYLSFSFCRKYHTSGNFQLVTNRKVQNADKLNINQLILLGAILRQRITIPPEGEAYDIQDSNAETVMKHYVKRNCLDISGMEFPILIIAPNQNINPPVIFSPEFDNVKSQEYIDSLVGFGNFAIVAGQGEGVEREIVMTGSEATGLDKHVVFVDARDIKDSADLEVRGQSKLNEYKRTISFKSEVLPTGPFEYEKDWNLGDVVTVQNKDWNITMDTRITEVTEIYEAGGFKLNVCFGESLPTLTERFKLSFEEMKIESTK